MKKALILSLLFCGTVNAETSTKYGGLARAMLSGFECSVYALDMGKEEEGARLFEYGYGNGKKYYEAAFANKIKDRSDIPLIVTQLSQGPSADFIMGRIQNWVANNVFESYWSIDDETKEMNASAKYREKNCSLLR